MPGLWKSPSGPPSLKRSPFFQRLWRGLGHAYNVGAFLVLCCYPDADNYRILRGKLRRIGRVYLSPRRHQIGKSSTAGGACARCGTSCKLGWQCFFWDARSGGCSIYEHRPLVCRVYPLDQKDVDDRNLVNRKQPCGYTFAKQPMRRARARR
ncbi:MAG: YkgJ family cysteine cluster protein [Planctomycetota bacterium]